MFSRGFAHGIQTKTRRWCRSWPLRLQIVLSVIGSEELRAATQLLLLLQHHYSGCFSSSHCCRRCQQKSSNLCRSGDRKSGETHADDKEDVRNVRCFYPWECQFSKVSVCSQGHYVSCLPGGQETRRRACAGPIPGLIAVLCSFFLAEPRSFGLLLLRTHPQASGPQRIVYTVGCHPGTACA